MVVNRCLKIISDDYFYVYDSPEAARACASLKQSEEYQNFKVTNPNHKSIRLLATDHCLFFDDGLKKCDFILYDEAVFCFIELKAVRKDIHKKRKNAKRYAEKQLLTTIELFQEKLRDFGGRILEAYLCVGYTTARPSLLSQSQRAKRDFVKLNTKLYDGCQKQFV